MKNIYPLLAIVVAVSFLTTTYAQADLKGHSGLYMTSNDYIALKLNLEVDCTKESQKIKVDRLFGASKMEIIHEGKKYNYEKKDLYGFRDCNNRDFRFVNNKEYEIIDNEYFILYNYQTYTTSGRTIVPESEYYISKDPGSPLLRLTVANLKSLFPDNRKFQDMLDAKTRSEKDLIEFDNYYKKYTIKHLFEESVR
jgi:hypothetical protein